MTVEQKELLISALASEFQAQVEAEQIGDNGRYRFAVVTDKFEPMTQLGRQDAAWAVVDRVLSREAALDISLILTYTPADLSTTHV